MKTVFLANKTAPEVMSLIKKLEGPHKPGAIILLSKEEFFAYQHYIVQVDMHEGEKS